MSSSQWLHLCLQPLSHPSSNFLSWPLRSIPWLMHTYLVEVFVLLKIFPKSLALYQQSNHSFIQYFHVNFNSRVNPRSLELELDINNTSNLKQICEAVRSWCLTPHFMVWERKWCGVNSTQQCLMTKHHPKRQNLALLIQLVINSFVSMINKSQDYGAVGYNENFGKFKNPEKPFSSCLPCPEKQRLPGCSKEPERRVWMKRYLSRKLLI